MVSVMKSIFHLNGGPRVEGCSAAAFTYRYIHIYKFRLITNLSDQLELIDKRCFDLVLADSFDRFLKVIFNWRR